MKITKRVAAVGTAGALSLAGLGLALNAPLAAAAADTVQTTVDDRVQAIKDALSGLVQDGTITQEQADTVAETLNDSAALRPHGPGGHGGFRAIDLDTAAQALGMTEEELHDALATEGTTLADVAQQEGVETSDLVDALVAAGRDRVEQAVTDGRLTRDQADELIAALPERVQSAVEQEFRGGRGDGPRHGLPPGGDDGSPDSDPGTQPQPESSATTESSSVTT